MDGQRPAVSAPGAGAALRIGRLLECSVVSRHFDWLRQADADLRLARHARDGAAHDWACFAAQQAAEKALKAVLTRMVSTRERRRISIPGRTPTMPSPAPNDSSASLVVKSNNEAAVERAVRAWARRIGAQRSEVRRIVWFGSRVNGIPAPGSDVDVCLVLASTDKPFRERAADYLPLGFPVGLDLFPYTVDEFDQLRRDQPSWHQAISAGVDLLPAR